MPTRWLPASLLLLTFAGSPMWAQDLGTLEPKPLPPLANPNDPNLPAKELFGRKPDPVALPPHSIGFYAKG
jgi:penicillin-insensitive murein DD-endopeptidase